MILRVIVFLIVNFAALGIGSIFTSDGVSSTWYNSLNQAPWTPPGWVFGAAWTSIMICFALYMAYAWKDVKKRKELFILFLVQWILNVIWNPVFFYYHMVTAGLIIITALMVVTGMFLFGFRNEMKLRALWVAPYFIWLCIATSLNAFILFNN